MAIRRQPVADGMAEALPAGRRRAGPRQHVAAQDGETALRGAERDELAPGLLDENVRFRLPAEVEEAARVEKLDLDQRSTPRVDHSGQKFLRPREKGLAFGGTTRGTEGHSSCLGRHPLRTWELRQASRTRLPDDLLGARAGPLDGPLLQREACRARTRQNAPGEVVPTLRRRKRQHLSELTPSLVRPPGVDAENCQRKVNLSFRVHRRPW